MFFSSLAALAVGTTTDITDIFCSVECTGTVYAMTLVSVACNAFAPTRRNMAETRQCTTLVASLGIFISIKQNCVDLVAYIATTGLNLFTAIHSIDFCDEEEYSCNRQDKHVEW